MKRFETVDISYKDNSSVNFLYNSMFGRVLLKLLIRPWLSVFLGFFMDRRISKVLIKSFIKNNNINANYTNGKYCSKFFRYCGKNEVGMNFRYA